jgi:dCMP deaminase
MVTMAEWQGQAKWDARFLALGAEVASWSKDPSTKTGAVIVRPDRTIASVGYNGFARGCNDDPAIYAIRDEKYQRVIHAEMNAILSAREPLHGYTLYSTLMTCDRCAVHIIQAGIRRVVAPPVPPDLMERWGPMIDRARRCFGEAGVRCDV